MVSQSGGVLVDQMVKFALEGVGMSLAVSIGNKAFVKELDLLRYLIADPGTNVIAFYIEGFGRNEGREFVQTASQSPKPVIALKTGKSPGGAKAVSPRIVHKSEHGAVVVGIRGDEEIRSAFQRLRKLPDFDGLLVEEMVPGIELIVGAKMDDQFGPVILLGMGGTGVEIYKDVALRMAPLKERDVASMIKGLKAHALLEGYRGAEPVNLSDLTQLLLSFSELVMDLQDSIESIDLNPVKCSAEKCVVADARVMLASAQSLAEH
jgi:acyl-CoA synthetase (NDP forming)